MKCYYFIIFIYILLASKNSYLHILRLPCRRHANFTIKHKDKYLQTNNANIVKTKYNLLLKDCALFCVATITCKSVNHLLSDGKCDLLMVNTGYPFGTAPGSTYYTTDINDKNIGPTCQGLHPCGNDEICTETCEDPFYKCTPDHTKSTTKRPTTTTKRPTTTTKRPTTSKITTTRQTTQSVTPTVAPENIALNKPIEMSTSTTTKPAIMCNDGNMETVCASSHLDPSPWIHIRLGGDEYTIFYVTIRSRGINHLVRVNGFGIYIGNDEVAATNNPLFTIIQQTTVNATYTNENEFKGRHFFIHNSNSVQWNVKEIEVYGAKS